MQNNNKTSKSIPDRWLPYGKYGTNIKKTLIMAFKVPLREAVAKTLPENEQFTIPILCKQVPNLKYVIDITNTNKYYNPQEFGKFRVKHEKIMVPGHQIPPKQCVKRFFNVMQRFKGLCRKGELIGVHCTHGVNRTGYLICRYLIEKLGWTCEEALEEFAKARGHPLERQNYIDDLKKISRNKEAVDKHPGSRLPSESYRSRIPEYSQLNCNPIPPFVPTVLPETVPLRSLRPFSGAASVPPAQRSMNHYVRLPINGVHPSVYRGLPEHQTEPHSYQSSMYPAPLPLYPRALPPPINVGANRFNSLNHPSSRFGSYQSQTKFRHINQDVPRDLYERNSTHRYQSRRHY